MNKIYLITIIALSILFIYVGYRFRKYEQSIMTKEFPIPVSSREEKTLEKDEFDKPVTKKGLGWSLSFWIYVDDWTYKYDKNKYIILWDDNIAIWLPQKKNELNIEIPIFETRCGLTSERIVYSGIPLQKWLHVTIILEQRNLDLWINGKLYSSRYLKNIPKQKPINNMEICPEGGYHGYISRLRYYSYPLPRENPFSIIFPNNILTLFKSGPIGFKNPFKELYDKIKGSVKINVSVSASTN